MSEGKSIKCKAAVSWGANEKFSVEEIEVAPPKAGEVRVKIVATGICFTDVSASRGKIMDVHFPIILGHEASGIVESVGQGVESVKSGDHVILMFLPQCKKCRVCKHDDANTCLEFVEGTQARGLMADETTRFKCRGKDVLHFMGCSTFTEYTVVKEFNVAKINPKAPLEKVCILSCGIPTGYGGSMKTAAVKKGSTCAVWGLGAVGLAALLGCTNSGATRIIGIDMNPAKEALARELGCTDFVNPKDVTIPMNKYLNEKFGAIDYTFECVGNVNTMKQAFQTTAIGNGVCVLIGVSPQDQDLNIPPIDFLFGRKLTGELFGSYKGADDVPKLVEDYLNGKLPLEKFITHQITLDEIESGFDLLKNGQSIRCVILNK
jgi:S-(hydroxymethyl)glutathione dehydrogenase/alcohol dehydrogenase